MSTTITSGEESGESSTDHSQLPMDQEKGDGCLLSVDDEGYETPGKKLPPLLKHNKATVKDCNKKVVVNEKHSTLLTSFLFFLSQSMTSL